MMYLVLGGARSGKSAYGERLATKIAQASTLTAKQIIYIATASLDDSDDEMNARIAHHKCHRPAHWRTLEVPKDLADTLNTLRHQPNIVIIIDCLTLWLSNVLMDDELTAQKHALLLSLADYPHQIIMISNETGLGVVPMGQLSRRFVDESGFLHQQLAKLADGVVFCVAGLPMVLKGKDALEG